VGDEERGTRSSHSPVRMVVCSGLRHWCSPPCLASGGSGALWNGLSPWHSLAKAHQNALVASCPAWQRGSPSPWGRASTVDAGGAVRTMCETLWPRLRGHGHDHGQVCACPPTVSWPPRHGCARHIARRWAGEPNVHPVTVALPASPPHVRGPRRTHHKTHHHQSAPHTALLLCRPPHSHRSVTVSGGATPRALQGRRVPDARAVSRRAHALPQGSVPVGLRIPASSVIARLPGPWWPRREGRGSLTPPRAGWSAAGRATPRGGERCPGLRRS
jgi:hypothetical protein